jgi:predicted S18 family serine protease
MKLFNLLVLFTVLIVFADAAAAQTRRTQTRRTAAVGTQTVSNVDISSGLKDALFSRREKRRLMI